MKKLFGLVVVLALLVACIMPAASADGIPASDIKVGVIFIHDENEGYTASHYEGCKQMLADLGLTEDQLIVKWNTPEDESSYDAAVDLAEQGCNIVFANSFGHESYLMMAASEYEDVHFCHATGFQAASSGMSNMHDYFVTVYQSRYVSGVVAGMKLNEMIANGIITEDTCKVGYIGAFPYAEVISGFSAFFLGMRSVCPCVTMDVMYTNSWASFDLEKEAAEALIANKCVLISQHADTTGAATACQAAGIPIVGYNVSMLATAPDYALTSAYMKWGPCYTYAVGKLINGETLEPDLCVGYDSIPFITELGSSCAEGTQEAVDAIDAAIRSGELKVFDTSTFTVNGGMTMEEYVATEEGASLAPYVYDGCFNEQTLASAPAFTLLIDGITDLTQN